MIADEDDAGTVANFAFVGAVLDCVIATAAGALAVAGGGAGVFTDVDIY